MTKKGRRTMKKITNLCLIALVALASTTVWADDKKAAPDAKSAK